jgi:GNAT superfamily N-acetyltransferase
MTIDVRPASADRLADLQRLFAANGTLSGCWCMYFLLTGKQFAAGWGEPNRARFLELAARESTPVGLLAYRDGEPIGWCAAGPRSRYGRATRSALYRDRDPAEDDDVWLVPCFFVHRGARRSGIMSHLLTDAVRLAQAHGARAVEGFPPASNRRHPSGEAYVGVEGVFAACGFREHRRPNERRVVMRLDLPQPASEE